jgi:hypothetical protein
MQYNLRKRKNISYKIINDIDKVEDEPKIVKKRKLDNNVVKPDKRPNNKIVIQDSFNQDIWKELMKYQNVANDDSIDIDSHDWIAASKTRNYLLKDPLADWLDLYFAKSGYNEDHSAKPIIKAIYNSNNKISEENILFDMGNKFEQEIFNYLLAKYKDDTVMVCKNRNDFGNKEKVDETNRYLKEGKPIILQAMLVNNTNKTFGVADILIRSDYINDLFKRAPVADKLQNHKAPLLNGDYHYLVIDIKWSNIPLCSNKMTILNNDSFMAYKGQLAIYNTALGEMQGFIPRYSYILGKSWKCISLHEYGSNSFDLLGTIDYAGFDNQYIKQTADAIKWLRDVRINGSNWSCIKPHRTEMYPNMCSQNSIWDKVKEKLSDQLKELTKIYMVGYKNRNYAHAKRIVKWNDPQCSAKNLGINGPKIGPIVDAIISINRDSKDEITPDRIQNNVHNWQKEHGLDFYIDFETFNEMLIRTNINIKRSTNSNIIFMKGVGYCENNKFKYNSFVLEKCTREDEKEKLENFVNFIEEKTKNYMVQHKIKDRNMVRPRLFHWANAEKTFLDMANEKFDGIISDWLSSVTLIDFCKVFMTEPILLKGMFKFKLKEIATIMYKKGMIKTNWSNNTNSTITNGFTAMMDAVKYYRKISVTGYEPENNDIDPIIDEIINYNYVDCKVLWEIISYLRKNNSNKFEI